MFRAGVIKVRACRVLYEFVLINECSALYTCTFHLAIHPSSTQLIAPSMNADSLLAIQRKLSNGSSCILVPDRRSRAEKQMLSSPVTMAGCSPTSRSFTPLGLEFVRTEPASDPARISQSRGASSLLTFIFDLCPDCEVSVVLDA